ncbi:MAG: hypothetical protein IPN25_03120 [Sphingobacteriales bacterium]|nr:hypothetical protein [Sphingobacteriales bacterium]MBK8677711.1 hypothetical protein [Sphingobacteriales bacterium]MBL0247407.1 hypothetical protein [Sphingobacteriales bacterium]MDA0198308.1 hypothetical protein [Bacteroidota bacterium]
MFFSGSGLINQICAQKPQTPKNLKWPLGNTATHHKIATDTVITTASATQSPPQVTPTVYTAANDSLLIDNTYWGTDSLQIRTQFLQYRDYFKHDDYERALPYWRQVFTHAPTARKITLINGEKLYLYLLTAQIEAAVCANGTAPSILPTDCANDNSYFARWKYRNMPLTKGYLDTLLRIYDYRAVYFGEWGLASAQKARLMQQYFPDSIKSINAYLNDAVNFYAEDAPPDILYHHLLYLLSAYTKGQIKKQQILNQYCYSIDVLQYQLATDQINNTANHATALRKLYNLIQQYSVIKQQPADTLQNCQKTAQYIAHLCQTNANNLDSLQTAFNTMMLTQCKNDTLYLMVLNAMLKVKPTAMQHRLAARTYAQRGDMVSEILHLRDAVRLEISPVFKARTLLELAKTEQLNDNFEIARGYAKQAIIAQPGWGDPYLFIGDLYLKSRDFCTTDSLSGWSVAWAAADMYARAFDLDPSQKAADKINAVHTLFPSLAMLRNARKKIGDKIVVPCWVTQTTTAR